MAVSDRTREQGPADGPTITPTDGELDPLDALLPAPRSPLRRLLIGCAVVGVVALLAWSWGFGLLRPRPECCGSGSASVTVTSDPSDPGAAMVSAHFFNSSAAELEITAADVELAGARVTRVEVSDITGHCEGAALPARVDAKESVSLLISFVPEVCTDSSQDWGEVHLDLSIPDRWWPTLDRTYTLPDPVVAGGEIATQTPLANACWVTNR